MSQFVGMTTVIGHFVVCTTSFIKSPTIAFVAK